ncbi:MAG: hypothetical protein ACYCUD_07155 [Candidatus Dormibacteria bacterium]
MLHAVTGFTNQSLRGQVTGLLGSSYSSSQMSYNLRHLCLHGLIQRTPGANSYTVTPDGMRVAVFYTKLRARQLRPLRESHLSPAALELRQAVATTERVLGAHVATARLEAAA